MKLIIDFFKKNKYKKLFIYILLILLLLPLFIIMMSLSIQSFNSNEVPSIGDIMPMIITSGSMEPEINVGDIILSKKVDSKDIQDGDIISFWDPENSKHIITHKVIKIYTENNETYFLTMGTYTGSEDQIPVNSNLLVGKYVGRIRWIGGLALFMQTPLGLITCLLIPLCILLIIDYYHKRRYDSLKEDEVKLLKQEIKKLKEKLEEIENETK